jgi:hypothetical protein
MMSDEQEILSDDEPPQDDLTDAERSVGLAMEKKRDPFGLKHPPKPTSNAEDQKR